MIYTWRKHFGEWGMFSDEKGYQRPVVAAVRATRESDRMLIEAAPRMLSALREIMLLLEDGNAYDAHTVAVKAIVDAGEQP